MTRNNRRINPWQMTAASSHTAWVGSCRITWSDGRLLSSERNTRKLFTELSQ